ncbi:MAG: WYL domain-containing protein, partial [Chloroflexi bacterium]|nr:WYL domain-containing protein [Chloroflexota bacterium]
LSHVVSPYLIEPSLWSDGAYVIGYSDVTNEVTPFKIERVEHAALTTEPFVIPEAFDEQALLKFAWGIWYGEGEPVTVKLRFAPGEAARRVQESIWHPTQQIEPCDDGGCVWRAEVAEWHEMVPWVRGWGADVEVLEPKALRETLMGEVKVMAERYGWHVYSHPADQPSSTLDDFFGGN